MLSIFLLILGFLAGSNNAFLIVVLADFIHDIVVVNGSRAFTRCGLGVMSSCLARGNAAVVRVIDLEPADVAREGE